MLLGDAMVDLPTFEKRFDRSFARVYAYVLTRVADRSTAERLTRDILEGSLGLLLEESDGRLDTELLSATQRALRDEATREPRVAGF
jgi:hypothetical protein